MVSNLAPWVVVRMGLAELLFGVSTALFEFMGVQISWWSNARWYVADRGLLFVKGKQSEMVRWDEMQTFFWSHRRSISSLVCPDGSTFRHLPLMDHAREVSNLVAGVVTKRLLPEVLAQYQRVGKVRFGAFVVTRESVTDWGRSGLGRQRHQSPGTSWRMSVLYVEDSAYKCMGDGNGGAKGCSLFTPCPTQRFVWRCSGGFLKTARVRDDVGSYHLLLHQRQMLPHV